MQPLVITANNAYFPVSSLSPLNCGYIYPAWWTYIPSTVDIYIQHGASIYPPSRLIDGIRLITLF